MFKSFACSTIALISVDIHLLIQHGINQNYTARVTQNSKACIIKKVCFFGRN